MTRPPRWNFPVQASAADVHQNPLLGVPPKADVPSYAEIEQRTPSTWNPFQANGSALREKLIEQYGVSERIAPKDTRWPFFHFGDKLVHGLLGLYATKYVFFANGIIPVEGVTDCGVLALLAETGGHYDSGYIAGGQVPTCLRCVSGVETEGVRFRNVQKQGLFGTMYGKPMSSLQGTNRPNMQQMPRKK